MKIGIMTFWWSNDNYGQLLQCYALQKYLRDRGHDAFLIRYKYISDELQNPFWLQVLHMMNPCRLFRCVLYRRRLKAAAKEVSLYPRHFEDFRNRYIVQTVHEYTSYVDLQKNPPELDAYIVGSDQLWNFGAVPLRQKKHIVHAHFLDFGGEKTKRLSYAVSFGSNIIAQDYADEIIPLLAHFDYVSVREKSGIALCEQCGYKNAEWVCDPTLLLRADEYRALYRENEIREQKKPFVLLYMLSNECDFDIQRMYDFAAKKGLEVVYVTGNGVIDKREKFFATIPEWLWLVENAEYVITNSFHCAIFSMIFQKRFGVIQLSGNAEKMNVRFVSLFEFCGIENRFISENDFSVLENPYAVNACYFSAEHLLEVLLSKREEKNA